MQEGNYRQYVSPETTPMLAPETWEQIISNLSPKDFHSAINTCPEWRQVMLSHKVPFLFPLILPMLGDYLPLKSILNLRGVMKDMKDSAVANLLSHYTGICPPVEKTLHFNKLSPIDRKYSFVGVESIEKFLGHMTSRPFPDENPFITGSISISLAGRDLHETRRSVVSFRSLFSRYGHHLTGIRFHELVIGGRIMETFFTLLHQLPNIQVMSLIGGVYMGDEYELFIRLPNLPHLENLKELNLSNVFELLTTETEFCLQLLVQYGRQLTSLGLNNLLQSPNVSAALLNSLVPNLKRFEMATMSSSPLQKLAAVCWPLEELALSNSNSSTRSSLQVNDFLEAVNNFSNTLVKLKLLCFRNVEGLGQLDLLRRMVNLPMLKMLTIEFVNWEVDWVKEFLRRSCQQLNVLYLLTYHPLRDGDVVELKRTFDWLPLLKKVVVLYGYVRRQRVIYRPVI